MAGEEDTFSENPTEEFLTNTSMEQNQETETESGETDQHITSSSDKQTLCDHATELQHDQDEPEQEVTELPTQEPSSPGASSNERLIKLPMSRIKHIMKTDPDVTLASQEAVVALAKATELFIASLSKDAVVGTLNSKRKTLQRKDLDTVLDTRDGYAFLEGTLD